MGCFGDKEKGELDDSQKWAYVTLSDFKASGALAYFSYAWLWFLAIVGVAVYGADTFTAVNLLAYDKWSSQIQPSIPLEYSKWIFAACIFVSWALCAFEWIRAIRVIRRGSVAESYMDPLAVTLQSMRPQGWKRFLVFAELTKSRKGVDYIALFVYYSFKGALRVILAQAPRQVINGITLYSVMKADIIPTGDHAATSGHSSIEQFFLNIETLAETNREQAVVLFTMLFTLIIWVISALSLIGAVILYIVFLWHYIPQEDGRLSIYCRRKIDRRLSKIVGAKLKQVLEDQEKERLKEEAKAVKNGGKPVTKRQPTLPQIAGTTPRINDDTLPDFKLARQDSEATLQSYSSEQPSTRNGHPGLPRQPTLPRQATLPDIQAFKTRPGMPSRNGTKASAISNISNASDAPLLSNATEMGYTDGQRPFLAYPRPVVDRQTSNSSYGSRPAMDRQMSASTYGSRPIPDRQFSSSSYASRPFLDRQFSTSSYEPGPTPGSEDSASPFGSVPFMDRQTSTSSYGPRPVPGRQMSASSSMARLPPMRSMTPLSEVSSMVSSLPLDPTYNTTSTMNMLAHEHNTPYGASPSPAQPTHEAPGPAGAPSYDHDQYRPSPPPTKPDGRDAPRYDAMTRRNTEDPVLGAEAPSQRPGVQPLHRPFSPPIRAATAMGTFSDRYNPDAAQSGQAFEMTSRAPATSTPQPTSTPSNGAYVAFNPAFSVASAPGTVSRPMRNLTSPMNSVALSTHPVPQRSATAPPEAGLYDDIIDEYKRGGDAGMPMRSATAGPSGHERW